MQGTYTVMCIVEAKPGKEMELKKLLLDVIAPSRNEASCLAYHLHQDLNNPALFILYEQWTNKEAHEQQFQKKYIIELASKLNELLAKPYQAFFAEELGIIKN